MVDQQVPTTQFHSYQPPDATPHSDRDMGHWGMLRKVGLKDSQIESMRTEIDHLDLQGSWNNVREYARRNPGKVLGGMAVLAIGAGLLGAMAARRRRGY
jgi:hypothetical protein